MEQPFKMPAPHTVPRLLRRQLISSPSPSSPQSYILPIRKLLVSYHEKLESHRGLRAWIQRHAPAIARKFPSVEVVLATHLRRGALLKGFYRAYLYTPSRVRVQYRGTEVLLSV